ncbi:MBL fold metallo-hydrolase [Parasphingopyxis lamellibrachiae]|uniref:Glyoxylase-like metal-dependent hydrolase (Beta-lactamase superfamily II) n=1 Tax=Parasphingopyxis lamellibrachiae TaxID=680125 RepID=A0A3D9FBK7_9SPHN|nr:MBL fold metallo-hydrolase [Parasphingopyxis lamellibrachiae]RED15210.1 glyoxylase-like metal-dependent hydrolase (beta-lactamase superfamily II) [Parasphingopyxis lamellibrachiae]
MRAAPFTIGLIAIALAFAGCDGRGSDAGDEPEANAVAELEIHRPHRPGPGTVNSYWLEGPDEILVFDTQQEIGLAERVVAAIQTTGKPVTAIIVSHYDPGHFGGIQAFTDAFPDAEILMTEGVAEQISRDLSGYIERLREAQGDDYRAPPEPTRLITNREELMVSGVPVVIHIVAGTEADTMAMLAIPSERALLASDLVANRMHPDFADADIDSWPRALDRIAREFTGYTLYPGHGDPGPASLLAANQIAYISFVRSQVERDILSDDLASEAEINAAIEAIRSNYPDWESATGRPAQLRRNLEAIVAQLGGELESEQAESADEAPTDG